jgi:hypothetical protein
LKTLSTSGGMPMESTVIELETFRRSDCHALEGTNKAKKLATCATFILRDN